MPDFLLHLRHAARSLRRSPVFTASAVLTLGVCIGANVAIFSMVDTLLLRRLPFPDPGRLVVIQKGGAFNRKDMLRVDVAPWIKEMGAFSSVGLFTTGTVNLSGGIEPVHAKAAMVSPGFLPTLGVRPALGRMLRPADHERAGAYAVMLGDGLWKRMFGGDRSLPGRTVLVNNRPSLVVGVMPPGFDFPDGSDLWVPATVAESPFLGGLRWNFVARLRPDVTPAQARAAGTMAARRNLPNLPRTYSFDVVPLHDVLAGPIRPTLLLFLAAVGVVLLVGCANVANLVLARMTARRTEMAIRAALGAGRSALIRQSLVEIAAVAFAGGVVGLLLARISLSALIALMPADVPGLDRIGVDARGAGFAIALSAAAVLLVGLLPALRIGSMDLQQATRGTGHGLRAGHRYLPRVFVVAELALAVLLSAGAGLLARSFFQLANVDPGFQPQGVLTMTVSMRNGAYRRDPTLTPEKQAETAFARTAGGYRQMLDRIRSVPGVEAAAAVDALPMSSRLPMGVLVTTEAQGPVRADYHTVTPGYFRTMAIPFAGGSDFAAGGADHLTVIISRGLARRLWGKDWIPGSRIRLSEDPEESWSEVIGVVGDVRSLGPERDAPPDVYVPQTQNGWDVMSLVVRTRGNPLPLAHALREQIRSVDPSVPVFRMQPMEQVVAAVLAPRRTSMLVLGLFAACAVLLAAMGVYGVTSYLVGLRLREFGVRLALGARSSQVLGGVLARCAVEAGLAAVIGIAGALALGRILKSFLVNVAPTDPVILGATSGALVAVAVLSSIVPARRAASVDPAVTLRVE